MKKIIILCIALLSIAQFGFAQKKRQSPKVSVSNNNIEIAYGQPSKKGRVIFGDLVPYDKVWRTGANEATEITFKKDATFGGKDISAGTYTLFTIPSSKEWTIILNSKLGQWGAYEYDKHKSKDVLQTKSSVNQLDNSLEQFTITIQDDNVTMGWDKTSVSVPYSIK